MILHKKKCDIKDHDFVKSKPLKCHRRIFIASLMCSHKYNKEPAPSNKAWSKLSVGLSIKELTGVEKVFLNGISFNLFMRKITFTQITENVLKWKIKNS